MSDVLTGLDLTRAEPVIAALRAGAAANRDAACRRGSTDHIEQAAAVIATGDLHDNPLHLARLVRMAGMDGSGERPPTPSGRTASRPHSESGGTQGTTAHITFHEIIHSDRLVNGMDFSFRALTRIAALKAAFAEHVHTLLANHELAQIVGAGIVKDGLNVVGAFNDAVEYAFGDDAAAVQDAIGDFIRSMPLALRCHVPRGMDGATRDTLCTHSLPSPELMDRFDATVLDHELTDDDYVPRRGSAHLLVWGRGHEQKHLDQLAASLGAGLFILGHEKADEGVLPIGTNALVLNTDHERGRVLRFRSDEVLTAAEAEARSEPLAMPDE
ncbi:MAG: hypothetical protein ACKVS8_01770 [Phycisphaerales bacterium]